METIQENTIIIEGKTKKIWQTEAPEYVIVESKDDITAGDGARHDVILGKAEFSNTTASNVFRLLKKCDMPVAFIEKISPTKFLAEKCAMIPYEVVVRREAHGSFAKRHPELAKRHIFSKLVIEFFLKTNDKKWQGIDFPKNDPLINFQENSVWLYLPDQPIHQQRPFAELKQFPLCESRTAIEEIKNIATNTFLILEKQWQLIDKTLVDLKMEFGINANGKLKLADVIDNDSWRLLDNGQYLDKQIYRDGAELETVTAKYRMVTSLTKNFNLPRQQLIMWRASVSDDLKYFQEAIAESGTQGMCEIKTITCSAHRELLQTFEEVITSVQEIPDSVIIAYAGRSNNLGPALSAQTSVPVITVPATWKEFPEDIWSSLRAPNNAPVMTVIDPKNAVLAAFQILAMKNPRLYAKIQSVKEKGLYNTVKF